jgi:hypothetical protein
MNRHVSSESRIPIILSAAVFILAAACSDPNDTGFSVDGLTPEEVSKLETLAAEGDCNELTAALEWFQIGVNVGALESNDPLDFVDQLLSDSGCRASIGESSGSDSSVGSADCDPNYVGTCVPRVDFDLDCADIAAPVQVVGVDVHGFDRDRDGIGCESN